MPQEIFGCVDRNPEGCMEPLACAARGQCGLHRRWFACDYGLGCEGLTCEAPDCPVKRAARPRAQIMLQALHLMGV